MTGFGRVRGAAGHGRLVDFYLVVTVRGALVEKKKPIARFSADRKARVGLCGSYLGSEVWKGKSERCCQGPPR